MSRKREPKTYWTWHCKPKNEWHIYYTNRTKSDLFVCGDMTQSQARKIVKSLNEHAAQKEVWEEISKMLNFGGMTDPWVLLGALQAALNTRRRHSFYS